jgi:hypothetical protein
MQLFHLDGWAVVPTAGQPSRLRVLGSVEVWVIFINYDDIRKEVILVS